MKARRVGLALAMLATLAVAAGSGMVRARAEPRPARPQTAEERRIDHLRGQLCSDVTVGRKINAEDVRYLLGLARRGGDTGSEALSALITLRFTAYHDEVLRVAFRMATREKASAAYSAIGFLECWRDPRWRALAEAHTTEPGEWGGAFREMIATSPA